MKNMKYIIRLGIIGWCLLVAGCSPKMGKLASTQKVGKIYIGQPYEETVQILGAPYKRESYNEIYDGYKKFGYNPEKILVFYLGFDFATEYDDETNRSEIPIYKLYFKDGKVHYIIFSSYTYGGLVNVYEWNGFKIFSERAALFKRLGRDYYFEDFSPNEYDGKYFYFDKGISLISEKNTIRAVHLFPRMNKKQATKYKRWKSIEIF